jgi:hypothetical protein
MDATSLLTQRGINQATMSVLKLMMIIQMYARFSMLRRRLMKLTGQMTGQTIDSRNPRIPSLHVDVLPDTGAWSADYINEATSVGGN